MCHQPVDVVVSELPHELHLLHDVTRDVLLAVEPQLLDPDHGTAVPRRLTLSSVKSSFESSLVMTKFNGLCA